MFKPIFFRVFIAIVVAGLAVWIALDTSKRPEQLISGAGYLVFLFGLFVTSKYPDRVSVLRPNQMSCSRSLREWPQKFNFCYFMLVFLVVV